MLVTVTQSCKLGPGAQWNLLNTTRVGCLALRSGRLGSARLGVSVLIGPRPSPTRVQGVAGQMGGGRGRKRERKESFYPPPPAFSSKMSGGKAPPPTGRAWHALAWRVAPPS